MHRAPPPPPPDTATIKLGVNDELHVVSGATIISVKLKSGAAEVRAEPLVLSETYILLPHSHIAILGGPGCELSVAGNPAHARVLPKPNHMRNVMLANLCEKLNAHRLKAYKTNSQGPVVLVYGAKGVQTVAKCLRNMSYRSNWLPTLINLDRTGCHAEIEFLLQGVHTFQAHVPDIMDEDMIEVVRRLETAAPNERLASLISAENLPTATVTRSRDGEHAKARVISLLSSFGRREATANGGVEANDVPVTRHLAEGRLTEAVSLNAWENTMRPLNGSHDGDIYTGCYCSLAQACTCGAIERMLSVVDAHLQRRHARLRAAGCILILSPQDQVLLNSVFAPAVFSKVSCCVECPGATMQNVRMPTETPVTRLPPSIESCPGDSANDAVVLNLEMRERQIFAPEPTGEDNDPRCLVIPKLVHGRAQQYIRDARDQFPLSHSNDLLPARLLLAGLGVPRYVGREASQFKLVDAASGKPAEFGEPILRGFAVSTSSSTIASPAACVRRKVFVMPGVDAGARLVVVSTQGAAAAPQ